MISQIMKYPLLRAATSVLMFADFKRILPFQITIETDTYLIINKITFDQKIKGLFIKLHYTTIAFSVAYRNEICASKSCSITPQ